MPGRTRTNIITYSVFSTIEVLAHMRWVIPALPTTATTNIRGLLLWTILKSILFVLCSYKFVNLLGWNSKTTYVFIWKTIATGWGWEIRTPEWRNQNPLSYRLTNPQYGYPFNLYIMTHTFYNTTKGCNSYFRYIL